MKSFVCCLLLCSCASAHKRPDHVVNNPCYIERREPPKETTGEEFVNGVIEQVVPLILPPYSPSS